VSKAFSSAYYYVHPKNDFVCVRPVWWKKRGADWIKTREYQLSGLHRVAGRAVADSLRLQTFDDPTQGLTGYVLIKLIDITVLTETDYPPNFFNPIGLTTGAELEAY
jgi:hypothetical protein